MKAPKRNPQSYKGNVIYIFCILQKQTYGCRFSLRLFTFSFVRFFGEEIGIVCFRGCEGYFHFHLHSHWIRNHVSWKRISSDSVEVINNLVFICRRLSQITPWKLPWKNARMFYCRGGRLIGCIIDAHIWKMKFERAPSISGECGSNSRCSDGKSTFSLFEKFAY